MSELRNITDVRDTEGLGQNLVVPVILSGGGGSRLWPFSTSDTPKQFLPLLSNDETLFHQALSRVRGSDLFFSPIVIASNRHAQMCEDELARDGDNARLVLEPFGRNTAAAVVVAALTVREMHGESALLLVMPSDHIIERMGDFHAAVAKGRIAAEAGKLVTFGIKPAGADTGYGYLQIGEDIPGCAGVSTVARFVEKPDLERAEAMVAGGDHLWNAGIFLFKAQSILDECERLAPAISSCARSAFEASKRSGMGLLLDAEKFSKCPSESIDNAVMELASAVAVVPMSPGWSDLGSWDALAGLAGADEQVGPVTALDCEGCYIRSDGVQIAALGLRDVIVVSSAGRLLIMPRGRSQEVKRLLAAMDSVAA